MLGIIARHVHQEFLLNGDETHDAMAVTAAIDGTADMTESAVDEQQRFFLHGMHHLLKDQPVVIHRPGERPVERVKCRQRRGGSTLCRAFRHTASGADGMFRQIFNIVGNVAGIPAISSSHSHDS